MSSSQHPPPAPPVAAAIGLAWLISVPLGAFGYAFTFFPAYALNDSPDASDLRLFLSGGVVALLGAALILAVIAWGGWRMSRAGGWAYGIAGATMPHAVAFAVYGLLCLWPDRALFFNLTAELSVWTHAGLAFAAAALAAGCLTVSIRALRSRRVPTAPRSNGPDPVV